jgi:hypothetical protein
MGRILTIPVLVVCLCVFASTTAFSGKNAGGALIVHTDDSVSYTTGDWCGQLFSDPGTCENAVTRTDKDENTPAVIWLLAAFPDTANPAVSVVYFGIEHNLPPNEGYFVNHGYCGPAGTIEVPDGGWPETGFGNSLAFGSPVQGDLLFPFYWFATYGTTASYLGTAENSEGGYAAFVDDSNPPIEDRITKFGTVRWYTDGSNDCPTSGGDGPEGPGGDNPESEDPTFVDYIAKVIDTDTGLGVSGVWIRGRQLKSKWTWCNISCSGCDDETEFYIDFIAQTDSYGMIELTKTDFVCSSLHCGGMGYCRERHIGWDPPVVEETPNAEHQLTADWLIADWGTGPGLITHTIYVTRESSLANRFSPLIHGHASLEPQQGLGDPVETSYHASLACYNIQGGAEAGPYYGGLHHWSNAYGLCSFTPTDADHYWLLNIDNDYRHSGATSPPVYYHVYPDDTGAVIQYWWFLNANDPLGHWPVGFHEGDWEHVAIHVQYAGGGRWAPDIVNFFQHEGGNAVAASDCWWSRSADPFYNGIEQGFSETHTHLNVWSAAGSHASYNRHDEVYTLSIPNGYTCQFTIWDYVDYGITDNPRGPHRFFTYDRLLPMGEYWSVDGSHDGDVEGPHCEGYLDEVRFVGRFGKGKSDCSPNCPDWMCEWIDGLSGLDFDTYSPESPRLGDDHDWREFHSTIGTRWGNDGGGGDVLFSHQPTRGDYGGLYHMCGTGGREAIVFPIRAHWLANGIARVQRISGDVVFEGATSCGQGCWEIGLGQPESGWYEFEWEAVSDTGRVEITVYAEGHQASPDIEAMSVDIVEDCSAAGVAEEHRMRATELRVLNAPAQTPLIHMVASGLEGQGGQVEVFGPGGRLLRTLAVRDGRVSWDRRTEAGLPVSAGVYLIRLRRTDGTETAVSRVVVLD